MCNNLKAYSAAAYPAVAVSTPDEERVTAQIIRDFPDMKAIWILAACGGLRDARTGATVENAQYPQAIVKAANQQDTILILLDYQHVIRNASGYRQLRLAFPALKANGSIVILLAPSWQLPEEIKHDVPVIESSLPSRQELAASLKVCSESVEASITDEKPILDSASGLTLAEAENAFALAYAEKKSFDPARILQEKLKLVRQSGQLEIALPADSADLGGLQGLREYVEAEVIPSLRDESLRVRGMLLLGIPGTGKSLFARVMGSLLQWPVLRCDMSSLKGSLVGQSEGNMRAALKLAEAVSPCILYMDEIEKAVAGHQSSGQTDSGVSSGMLGILLTWLQEHKSPIIVIATCNRYETLPAELTRAGRIDERWFVDLPTKSERQEIAAIHLRKFGVETDGRAEVIADLSDGWTGAEIEQLVKSAARRHERKPTAEQLTAVSKEIKPISKVRADEIQKLRDWGKAQLRIANTQELQATGRKVRAI